MHLIDTFFDKIYYINLDCDVERNENMISQFEKYNISNYERISATIIDSIPDKYYWRNFNIDKLNEKYIIGSLGCRNSHWKIMKDAFEKNYQKILIFEDDVLFTQDPNKVLNDSIPIIGDDWHMLYFGGIEEHHFGGQIVCTHAYAVNRKLIEEIYFMLPSSGMEVDNFYAKVIFHMSYNYSPTGKYLIKKTNPFNTVIQDNSYLSKIKI